MESLKARIAEIDKELEAKKEQPKAKKESFADRLAKRMASTDGKKKDDANDKEGPAAKRGRLLDLI